MPGDVSATGRFASISNRKLNGWAGWVIVESLEARQLLSVVRPDHIVIVIEQDRASDMIGNPIMPYLNALANTGLFYSNTHGVTHPTEPNELALYSGSTQGVTSNSGNLNFPTQTNLAKVLFDAEMSFGGFVENLPADGSQVTLAGDATWPDIYSRNTNAMAQFGNIGIDAATGLPRANSAVNRTFAAFSSIPVTDYSSLPTVSFIVPSNMHSTHGSNEAYPWAGSPDEDNNNLLRTWADDWLHDNLDPYLQWAKTHNSLLIVTGDEQRYTGGTANALTTVVNGSSNLFNPGVNPNLFTHFNLLRTITDMYGIAPLGDTAGVSAYDTDALGKLSTSTPVPASTTTGLASSNASSVFGQSVTFTATVTGGSATPTGTVTFKDGTTVLGTGSLNASGIASFTTFGLSVGAHTITASFAGDSTHAASDSAAFIQNIVLLGNNNFANRTTISGTSITASGSNVGATRETGEPNHAGNAGGKSVWWTWTAPSAGTVTIDTLGSDFDTLLAVYTGTSVSALTAVNNGSNNNSPAGGTTTSKVTFTVTSGKVYAIAVDGNNGAAGNIALHVNLVPAKPSAPTGVSATDGTLANAVRVTWTAPANATAYEVWRNTTNKTASAVKINAADVIGTTYDDATAAPGKTYYYWIKAKNAGGTSGFSGANTGYRPVAVMSNNLFANRTAIVGPTATLSSTNVGATKETGEPNHAGFAGGKSVWWTWTAPTSGTVTIDTLGSNFDTLLAVYTGSSLTALTQVAANDDDFAGGTTTSKVTFAVTAGMVYQIAVDGYGGASGSITLHLNLT